VLERYSDVSHRDVTEPESWSGQRNAKEFCAVILNGCRKRYRAVFERIRRLRGHFVSAKEDGGPDRRKNANIQELVLVTIPHLGQSIQGVLRPIACQCGVQLCSLPLLASMIPGGPGLLNDVSCYDREADEQVSGKFCNANDKTLDAVAVQIKPVGLFLACAMDFLREEFKMLFRASDLGPRAYERGYLHYGLAFPPGR
jgi:hypothetical protein